MNAVPTTESSGDARHQIDLTVKDERWLAVGSLLATLQDVAVRALQVAGEPRGRGFEVSIALVSDEEMVRLNRTYRNIEGPTNVLSFAQTPLPEQPPGARRALGDVVLARETIAGEAQAQGKPVRDHAAHMVAHGILHLLDYDHRTAGEENEMRGLERQILAALGIPDPYDAILRADTDEP